MSINVYVRQLRELIESFPLVQLFDITVEERGKDRGFIRGEINFKDGTILHWREFVNVKITIERGMYSYQYMTSSKELIFRYDNTEHHKKLNLPNYPHHKHDGIQDNIISSNAPTLGDVLEEIERMLE